MTRTQDSGSPFPDIKVGTEAVRRGLITQQQLKDALDAQKSLSMRGTKLRLGEILGSMGYLTSAQMALLLGAQNKRMLACGRCAKRFNIADLNPDIEYRCPRCRGPLSDPGSNSALDADGTWFTEKVTAPLPKRSRPAVLRHRSGEEVPHRFRPYGKGDGRGWMIASGAGTLGLLVLLVIFAVSSGGDPTPADRTGSGAKPGESPKTEAPIPRPPKTEDPRAETDAERAARERAEREKAQKKTAAPSGEKPR